MQELEFKGQNNLRRGFLPAKAAQKTVHQFKNGGQWRPGFRGLLDERRGVGGLAQPAEVLTQRAVGLAQTDFTERVQIGTAAAAERKIRQVKQIQFAEKRRLNPARAFGDGGDAPEIRREPVDDEAGFRERSREAAGSRPVAELYFFG
jgi:hypothetical protein